MRKGRKNLLLALILAAAVFAPLAAQAGVNVDVNIGLPAPPPIVVASPPRVVVVPGSPVSYAPDASVNLFVYGGRYYTFHQGSWFVGPKHSGPWTFIAVERVPAPVVAVPVKYYRVAPGQGVAPGPGVAPGQDKGPHCPPGQAKKGRC
jgi:hypothetical protein